MPFSLEISHGLSKKKKMVYYKSILSRWVTYKINSSFQKGFAAFLATELENFCIGSFNWAIHARFVLPVRVRKINIQLLIFQPQEAHLLKRKPRTPFLTYGTFEQTIGNASSPTRRINFFPPLSLYTIYINGYGQDWVIIILCTVLH